MTTFTQAQGARSSSVLNIGTLAAGGYTSPSAVIDLGANIPLDVTFEIEGVPNGTPTGNKQLVLFALLSLDNTNFGTGATASTDENQALWVGTLPVYTSGATHRRFCNLAGLPVARYLKLVIKNDTGVAMTSGNVYKADITGAA